MKILLHACCGPCSLEPVRLLLEEGHRLTIMYANSNIHPKSEYQLRLQTLLAWANDEGIPVVEGNYNPSAWHDSVGSIWLKNGNREGRCRSCYRMRLEETARYAAENGFQGLATTLTVSPYQYTFTIAEELERACKPYGLTPVFRDYRPYYHNATLRSRALGMYRQNYCGCVYSDAEARAEREERKQAREAEKARRAAERAPLEAAQEQARKRKAAERAEYDRKQRAKREMRNKIRAQMKAQAQHLAQSHECDDS
ncbi:MAG: epoxyqueuosine reductase QueH [Eggerthellaceae bacterium]|nr:epoxyqueuosine reductase QueH [Eggerthellaceae bacterium]